MYVTRCLLFLLVARSATPFPVEPTQTIAHIGNAAGRVALLWSSIALAVVTSLLQSAVTTVVAISEDNSMWTFRFRIAQFEHWWWTIISVLLAMSFSLIVVSFIAGNSNDAVGVLILSTATMIAIVRFASPAWHNRHYIRNRWLAWTGPSRTSISCTVAAACGDRSHWQRLAVLRQKHPIPSVASDDWGLTLFGPPQGLEEDPTAILTNLGSNKSTFAYQADKYPRGYSTYDDGVEGSDDISLLWGASLGFRPRCSRAVSSMPIGLLKSRPFTVDGYNGEGLCIAMGILGRTKGLRPWTLVYDQDNTLKLERGLVFPKTRVTTILESTSSFLPRANKVMRSYYEKTIKEQFGGLGISYCFAATELSLVILDCPRHILRDWLDDTLEQQSLDVNQRMRQLGSSRSNPAHIATPEQLNTLYRASYVSMIVSLNFYVPGRTTRGRPQRPDLICFALLWLAEHAVKKASSRPIGRVNTSAMDESRAWFDQGDGVAAPSWWSLPWVQERIAEELGSLKADFKQPAAMLLGLVNWPNGLESWPSWPSVVYQPVYD